jgi:hypothetical protein
VVILRVRDGARMTAYGKPNLPYEAYTLDECGGDGWYRPTVEHVVLSEGKTVFL